MGLQVNTGTYHLGKIRYLLERLQSFIVFIKKTQKKTQSKRLIRLVLKSFSTKSQKKGKIPCVFDYCKHSNDIYNHIRVSTSI